MKSFHVSCFISLALICFAWANPTSACPLRPTANLQVEPFNLDQETSRFGSVANFFGIPPGFDFWNEAIRLDQKTIVDHANKEIASAKKKYADVASKIDDFMQTISASFQELVDQTKALKIHGLNVKEFSENFSQEIDLIFVEFKETFGEKLPEDRTERYKELEKAVDWILDKLEDALVNVLVTFNIEEPRVREGFDPIKPKIKRAMMLTVEIVDRHPGLLITLILFILPLLISEVAIVRVLLRCVGFGPLGPIKGSPAALAQRYFFGGAVAKGSWFAALQAAGMSIFWL